MQKFTPPKKTELLWYTRCVIGWVVLCVFLLVFHVKRDIVITIITVSAVLLTAVIIYLRLFVKKYCITVTPKVITVKSGVIIRVERVLPAPRLIYTESFASPLARAFGLSQLSFRATKVNLVTVEFSNDVTRKIMDVISGSDE